MKITDIVGGIPVAQGTDVATCIGSIQRNPAYFKEPNKFIPERWLAEFEFQDEKQAELAKRAFVPFSLGSRGCIGKNLAYMEITTLLAQIMYRSDWKSTEGPQGRIGEVELNDGVEFETAAHFTSWKNGPFIQFKARDA
jgi:cytochrome P450